MSDVQSLLDAVFTEEWLEGNQMRVATATISDYMNDFEDYLVAFWADKFVYTILEEVILSYTRSVIFKSKAMQTVASPAPPPLSPTPQPGTSPTKAGFLTGFFQKTKQTMQTIAPILTPVYAHVAVDPESIGRLAQDVNILNAFFSKKASQQVATEFLELINEVNLLMIYDLEGTSFSKCIALGIFHLIV